MIGELHVKKSYICNIEERCVMLAEYLVETRDTVRGAASHFGISKSTVHKDVTQTLRGVNLDLYERVKEFLEINKSINVAYIKDDLLIERDFKEYEGKEISLIPKSDYWNILTPRNLNVESMESVINRVKLFLNKIKEEYPNKNILIVSHSGVCRAIKYILEGEKEKDLSKYDMPNLKVCVYREW